MQAAKKDYQGKTLKRLHYAIGGKCYLCGCDLDENEITKDHVFPKSLGYTISYNMMPAHKECNSDKGDRIPTIEEIQLACEAYDAIYMTFAPRTEFERRVFTKPIQHYVHKLYEHTLAA